MAGVVRPTRPIGLRRGHFGRNDPVRCGLADECVYGFGFCDDPLRGDGDAGLAHQGLSFFALLGQDDGDNITGAASPRGASGSVEVCLVFGRGIDVHDQFHIIDVNAACCDVGGDQNHDVAGGEFRKVAVTGRLRQIAVQINRRHPGLGELLG